MPSAGSRSGADKMAEDRKGSASIGTTDADAGGSGHVDTEERCDTYAEIMARHPPDVLGKGHVKMYLLTAAVCLCSTMNGTLLSLSPEHN